MLTDLFVIFHGIGDPPAHIPAEERPYWIPEQTFRAFIRDANRAACAAGVQIVPTFDDGNRSDVDIAAPVLVDSKLPGLFFPCTGRIGRKGYLTEADLRTLNGHAFEIGSHGVDHVPWRRLDPDALYHEIAHSKVVIERILGHDITSAALPFGYYDAATLRLLRKSGYKAVYSSAPGISPADSWFRCRWCYRKDKRFDIQSIARRSRTLGFRLVSEGKHFLKSLL
jgi:peptidoglycan/xylan/chitin deacetylase (PgdA/CDA1 family)